MTRTRVPKGDRMATEAYCVKCRAKKTMKDEQAVTMKNGKPATQGICPDCGADLNTEKCQCDVPLNGVMKKKRSQ